MSKYYVDRFEFDMGKYLSDISRVTSSVYDIIRKYTDFIQREEEENHEVEIIEDFGSVKYDSELLTSISELMTDLKNQSLHNSLVITVYSYLEYSLIEFCRLVELYTKPTKSLKEIHGTGLDKCKDFLNQNFALDISKHKDWGDLKTFQKIRNLIAHNNASIYKETGMNLKDQPEYNFINGNKNLRLSESGTFFIKEVGYISSFADMSVDIINYTIKGFSDKVTLD